MSVTILEALLNAEINLEGEMGFQKRMGLAQLHNAIVLLDKGYGAYELVEPLLEEFGVVENVPEKEIK